MQLMEGFFFFLPKKKIRSKFLKVESTILAQKQALHLISLINTTFS